MADQRNSRAEASVSKFPAHLSLWDSVSLIVGIVIGAGIFETAPLIFANTESPSTALLLWGLGGFLSLIGALCYAELASAYPKLGGDYVYLSKAFGSCVGFLFGWAQLTVILTGSIAMMAYIFADYATAFFQLKPEANIYFAIGAVLVFSFLNVFILVGKRTQNLFSWAKIFGFLLVVLAGFLAMTQNSESQQNLAQLGLATLEWKAIPWDSISLAMVFVLYTYGGWNDAAFVASELRRRRDIPLALILGTLAIACIYLLVNAAYIAGLGFAKAQSSKTIAADLLRWPFGDWGSRVMSLLVMLSALGAVNGLIFTGSRLYSALGPEHKVFHRLGRWHPRYRSPLTSLVLQAMISVGLMLLLGTENGRAAIASALSSLGFAAPSWEGHGGFDTLLRCTAPVFWSFFLLTGISLFVLRWKEPHRQRPFRVPLFPLTPFLFCLTSLFMLYRSLSYAGALAIVGLLILLLGLPFFYYGRRSQQSSVLTTAIPQEDLWKKLSN